MKLTDDVMKDLLVVYLSGEASADTKALVEAYAREHPGFNDLIQAAGAETAPAAATPGKDVEMKSLQMVRQFVFLRSLFIGMGIAATLIPFTFVIRNGEMTFLMMRDVPGIAPASWAIAAASWVACYVMHRAIRKAGL
jgi:hypothetical protein